MKGTFREIINYYAAHDMEFDAVIGDVEMDATYSFCDAPKFTEYCEKKYGDLLNANAEVKYDKTGRYTDVVVVDYDDFQKGRAFTMAWAGYIADSEYCKLFGEDDDE